MCILMTLPYFHKINLFDYLHRGYRTVYVELLYIFFHI